MVPFGLGRFITEIPTIPVNSSPFGSNRSRAIPTPGGVLDVLPRTLAWGCKRDNASSVQLIYPNLSNFLVLGDGHRHGVTKTDHRNFILVLLRVPDPNSPPFQEVSGFSLEVHAVCVTLAGSK